MAASCSTAAHADVGRSVGRVVPLSPAGRRRIAALVEAPDVYGAPQ